MNTTELRIQLGNRIICQALLNQTRRVSFEKLILEHVRPFLLTLIVADISKVLTLDDLLYDVVGVHAGVVHPGGMVLHRVLLPPRT